MKSKILDAVHQTATGMHKSVAITDESKMEFDKLCLQPSHDGLGISRKPGAWSGLPKADSDWDSQNTNAEIAQTLSKDNV